MQSFTAARLNFGRQTTVQSFAFSKMQNFNRPFTPKKIVRTAVKLGGNSFRTMLQVLFFDVNICRRRRDRSETGTDNYETDLKSETGPDQAGFEG